MSSELSGVVPDVGSDLKLRNSPLVIDLGKHRRKRVKDLRNGKPGRLLSEVQTAIEALKSQGAIAPGAQPVIVVVREKRRGMRGWGV